MEENLWKNYQLKIERSFKQLEFKYGKGLKEFLQSKRVKLPWNKSDIEDAKKYFKKFLNFN